MPWQVDEKAVERAKGTLEVRGTVKFRRLKRFKWWGMTISTEIGDNFDHTILLSKLQPLDEANNTIWHELTHAAQYERLGITNMRIQYNTDMEDVGFMEISEFNRNMVDYAKYVKLPLEAEAIGNAEKYIKYRKPLVKSTRSW